MVDGRGVSDLYRAHISGAEDAPPLVLIHPIATNAHIWSAQAAILAQRWRVIAVDLPGHGDTPTLSAGASIEDFAHGLARTLEFLRVERSAILGLSLGGMVAQAFALNYPDRAQALILAHTSSATPAPVGALWDERVAHLQTAGFDAHADQTLGRWFTPDFASRAPHTLAWVKSLILSTPVEGYTRAIRAIQNLDLMARLGGISAPTLVLSGEKDAAATPAIGQAMADRIPRARFTVLSDAAHLGNVEQPVAFTETIGAFLASLG